MSDESSAVPAQETPVSSKETTETSTETPVEQTTESSNEGEAAPEETNEPKVEAAAEQIKEAIEDGATETEVKEMIETFKIKTYGKEKEIKLDWNNKEDIKKRLEMAEAAPIAMQRAAEFEKRYKEGLKQLVEDPWTILKEAGHDPLKLSESRINEEIANLEKTPEQKIQDEKDKELENLRTRVKKEEEEKDALKFQQLQKQAEINLEKEITEAISATTQLPKSPYVMKRIADAMGWFMDQVDENKQPKYPDVTAKQIVPIVEKEINAELNKFFEEMPDQVLKQFFSYQLQDRLRKQRLDNMPKGIETKDIGKNIEDASKEEKKISMREFMKGSLIR